MSTYVTWLQLPSPPPQAANRRPRLEIEAGAETPQLPWEAFELTPGHKLRRTWESWIHNPAPPERQSTPQKAAQRGPVQVGRLIH